MHTPQTLGYLFLLGIVVVLLQKGADDLKGVLLKHSCWSQDLVPYFEILLLPVTQTLCNAGSL